MIKSRKVGNACVARVSRRGLAAFFAFTMAEILLSLTIIGVVAAITLPSLMGNINERTWNTQRKALHARMSQAIAMMPQLNGYGKHETDSDGNVTDTATEAFLTEGLSKVLKINNICDNEHLNDCGIANSMTTFGGTTKTWSSSVMLSDLRWNFSDPMTGLSGAGIDYKAAAFETQNGESVLTFYNPNCQSVDYYIGTSYQVFISPYMCVNFVYDLNGNKGPNTMGKDVGFITVLRGETQDIVVAPMPIATQSSERFNTYELAATNCVETDAQSRVPNIYELHALFYNYDLIGNMSSLSYYSSSKITSGQKALMDSRQSLEMWRGTYGSDPTTVRCVKR